MTYVDTVVARSRSPLGFQCDPPGPACWNRFLTVDGERVVDLGVTCDSCEFVFRRLRERDKIDTPEVIGSRLGRGLTSIDKGLIAALRLLLPDGRFFVRILAARPRLVRIGTDDDYFTHDLPETWVGRAAPTGIPAEYYRGRTQDLAEGRRLFEFMVPLLPAAKLDPARVASYEHRMSLGESPAALAISVLEVRHPYEWWAETSPPAAQPDILEHWLLAHYLIDGHHKIAAAANLGTQVDVLSCLAVDESVATLDQLRLLYQSVLD